MSGHYASGSSQRGMALLVDELTDSLQSTTMHSRNTTPGRDAAAPREKNGRRPSIQPPLRRPAAKRPPKTVGSTQRHDNQEVTEPRWDNRERNADGRDDSRQGRSSFTQQLLDRLYEVKQPMRQQTCQELDELLECVAIIDNLLLMRCLFHVQ